MLLVCYYLKHRQHNRTQRHENINRHGDALDKGNNRVYFDDTLVVVVKFNNPRAQLIEAKSTIDSHLGDDVVLNVIDALTK